jgi:integrase
VAKRIKHTSGRTSQAKRSLPPYVLIRQRGDIKQWRVRRVFRTEEVGKNGKPVYVAFERVCWPETPERAAELVRLIESEVRGEPQIQPDITKAWEFIGEFIAAKKKSVSTRTYEYYDYMYRRYVERNRHLSVALSELKPRSIENFYTSLETDGVSGAMIRKVHALVSMAMRQAVKWGDIGMNVAAGALLPKAEVEDPQIFTQAESKLITTYCLEHPEYLIFQFALETGMRPEEYLATRWTDIDFEQRAVHVRRAVTTGYSGGGFKIGNPKTKSSKRTIGVSQFLLDNLSEHRNSQLKEIAKLRRDLKKPLLLKHIGSRGTNYKKRKRSRQRLKLILGNYAAHDLVFPSATGAPRSRLNLNRRDFKQMLQALGLDSRRYSIYSLRHTTASILANHIQPKELQKFLGHKDVVTTFRYYVHVNEDSENRVTDRLSKMLYSS